jgi:hypothetical protein
MQDHRRTPIPGRDDDLTGFAEPVRQAIMRARDLVAHSRSTRPLGILFRRKENDKAGAVERQ